MTKEHFWTLDTAALTWFRTLYPRIQRGHWRYFGTQRWTKATGITTGGERNTLESNRLRERAHSPPLPSILLANVQSLENKMDYLRASISFQRDIRDCNILCLTKTWLTLSVPDTAVRLSDNFSILRMDRTAEAGKTKGGGVCFMINKKWCDPRNISILSRSCSPHLEHLSIICRPFYLPREFSSIVVPAVYIPPQADTSLALSKLHDELSGYINKHPDAASIIAGDFNKANLKKVMPNFHQHVFGSLVGSLLHSKTVGGQNNPWCS